MHELTDFNLLSLFTKFSELFHEKYETINFDLVEKINAVSV